MLLFHFILTFVTFKDCKENKAIDQKTAHNTQCCILLRTKGSES